MKDPLINTMLMINHTVSYKNSYVIHEQTLNRSYLKLKNGILIQNPISLILLMHS